MPIRLCICDDKDSFRRMLVLCLDLEPDIDVIGEAADGNEAVTLVASTRPDVLLLDVSMPRVDGIEALPRILEASPETVVIMLSGFASRKIADQALAAGAWRFLEKGTSLDGILGAIREAAATIGVTR